MARGAIEVRISSPDDADAVSQVLSRSYGTLYRGWYRDDVIDRALPAMSRANPVLLNSGRYFVGVDDGMIIGCGGWSAQGPTGGAVPRLAHMRHFATDPDHLNRGCGSAIARRCFDEAFSGGFTEMEVISSLTAEAFYARHGFRQIAMVRQKMGDVDFACVMMRKKLETANENAHSRI